MRQYDLTQMFCLTSPGTITRNPDCVYMPRRRSRQWGGVDAPAGKQGFPKLGLNPHLPLPSPLLLSQDSIEPFGQLSVLVSQAVGLCAGFKAICCGKIGLVYQPRFIVRILF